MPNTPQSVIDFFLVPQIGELQAKLDENGPYPHGNHILNTWKSAGVTLQVKNTAGVIVQFNGAIPAKLGRTPGFDDGGTVILDLFEERLVQLAALHQLAFSGPWVATQVEEIYYLPYLVKWAEALPGIVGLYNAPGITVDLYYLVTIL
jgi:hypothetical protein